MKNASEKDKRVKKERFVMDKKLGVPILVGGIILLLISQSTPQITIGINTLDTLKFGIIMSLLGILVYKG